MTAPRALRLSQAHGWARFLASCTRPRAVRRQSSRTALRRGEARERRLRRSGLRGLRRRDLVRFAASLPFLEGLSVLGFVALHRGNARRGRERAHVHMDMVTRMDATVRSEVDHRWSVVPFEPGSERSHAADLLGVRRSGSWFSVDTNQANQAPRIGHAGTERSDSPTVLGAGATNRGDRFARAARGPWQGGAARSGVLRTPVRCAGSRPRTPCPFGGTSRNERGADRVWLASSWRPCSGVPVRTARQASMNFS